MGKGVYVLYDDGENLRLLTMLYEEQVSGYPKVLRENYGVYTTGDNVMMIDHDYKALWNRNFLQRMGYTSYSSNPQQPARLDRKDTAFMLCARRPEWDQPSKKIPRVVAQLLYKASKESSSPQGFRYGMDDPPAGVEKPLMELAGVPINPVAPEKSNTTKWPTYRLTLQSSCTTTRKTAVSFLPAVFQARIPEAAISQMEEEGCADGVSCLVSCSEEDTKRLCEVLRRNDLIFTIEPV